MTDSPKTKGSLLKRIITTIIGVSYFIGMCFWGQVPFCAGVTVVVSVGISEFVYAYSSWYAGKATVANAKDEALWVSPFIAWLGLAFPAITLAMSSRANAFALPYAAVMVGLICIFAYRLLRASSTGRALGQRRVHYGVIASLYVGMLFSSFVLVRSISGKLVASPFRPADRGAWLMLFAAMCVWATDTFAYFVGRSMGRTPLAPKLSPGKTVEGAVGGLIGAIVVGVSFGTWIGLPWIHGLAVGLLTSLAGQIGDLFESALKREIEIKDFGRIMPGHGGILDRVDSLLFAIPVAYLYFRVVLRF